MVKLIEQATPGRDRSKNGGVESARAAPSWMRW